MKKLLAATLASVLCLSQLPVAFAANSVLKQYLFDDGVAPIQNETVAGYGNEVIADPTGCDMGNILKLTKDNPSSVAPTVIFTDDNNFDTQRGLIEVSFDYYIPQKDVTYNTDPVFKNSATLFFRTVGQSYATMFFKLGSDDVKVGTNAGKTPTDQTMSVTADEWHNARFILDTTNETMTFYHDTVFMRKDDYRDLSVEENTPIQNSRFRGVELEMRKDVGFETNRMLYIDNMTITQLYTDAEAVAADAAALDLGDVSALESDIVLPTMGEYGSTIVWSSSDETVISNTGAVTRSVGEDKQVTLTATMYRIWGGTDGSNPDHKPTATKTFDCTVKGMEDMNSYLNSFLKNITLSDLTSEGASMITSNLTLTPLYDVTDSDIVINWTSSDENVISKTGVVTRDAYLDKDVTLTLELAIPAAGARVTKEFNLRVLATDEALVADDFTSGSRGWTVTEPISDYTVAVENAPDDETNKALRIHRPAPNTNTSINTQAMRTFAGMSGVTSIATRLYMNDSNNFRGELLFWDGNGANQAIGIGFEHKNGKYNTYFNYDDATEVPIANAFKTNKWIDVEIVVDNTAKAWDLYVDGVKLNTAPLGFKSSTGAINQVRIQLNKYYQGADSSMYVDDFIVRNLSDKAVVARAINKIDIAESATSDVVLPKFAGTTTAWSVNGTGINNEGKVSVAKEDQQATLSVSVTRGEETESDSFVIKVPGSGVDFAVTDVEFLDSEGAASEVPVAGGKVSKVVIKKYSDINNADLRIAVYDGTTFKNVVSTPINTDGELTTNVAIDNSITELKIKVMIWDSSMVPLAEAYSA